MEQKDKKIISVLVEDEFGALSRIIELFGSRGYNLHSICSGEARAKGLQRLTLVCYETDKNIQQIIKLLRNIIYIHEAKIIETENSVHKELILIKVALEKKTESELFKTIRERLKGEICRDTKNWVCFQYVGDENQINQMVELIRSRFKILEVSRTGEAALDCKID